MVIFPLFFSMFSWGKISKSLRRLKK
jgi:hypothetical protein